VSPGYPERDPAEVAPELARYRIVDVREPHEWTGELGRIAESLLIPLGELESRLEELRGEAPLLLVCRSGNRSGKACLRLLELGFVGPTNLVGGMIAWNEAGLPVLRTESPRG
jgi:rhodanese-related sulfurtransferase